MKTSHQWYRSEMCLLEISNPIGWEALNNNAMFFWYFVPVEKEEFFSRLDISNPYPFLGLNCTKSSPYEFNLAETFKIIDQSMKKLETSCNNLLVLTRGSWCNIM